MERFGDGLNGFDKCRQFSSFIAHTPSNMLSQPSDRCKVDEKWTAITVWVCLLANFSPINFPPHSETLTNETRSLFDENFFLCFDMISEASPSTSRRSANIFPFVTSFIVDIFGRKESLLWSPQACEDRPQHWQRTRDAWGLGVNWDSTLWLGVDGGSIHDLFECLPRQNAFDKLFPGSRNSST